MRSTLLLPVDLLTFLARKVNALRFSSKFLLVSGMLIKEKILQQGAFGSGFYYLKHYRSPKAPDPLLAQKNEITERVYFDLAADNVYLGRILIGLYGNIHPLTCENFVQMCKGHSLASRLLGYLNTRVTHVLPSRGIVMGDLFHPGGKLDSCTIYGSSMPEEGFDTDFVQAGDVAMLPSNEDVGLSSRFLITLTNNPCLGRKCVVIGTVVKGMKVIRSIGSESTVQTVPKRDIRVIGCGLYRGPEDGPKSYFVKQTASSAETN